MSATVAADLKLIIFQLLDKEYAISVNQVRSIEKILHITRVPNIAPFVKGVINLRGVVTPIIDLKNRFDMGETSYLDSTRIIIVSLDDMEVGLIVDSANDVIDIKEDSIEPAPEIVGAKEVDYISGVVKIDKRLLILINLEKVLDREALKKLSRNEG